MQDGSDELGCHTDHKVNPSATPSCYVGLFPCDETRCFRWRPTATAITIV